jgi:hypothetical protein
MWELNAEDEGEFRKIHQYNWEEKMMLSDQFSLTKSSCLKIDDLDQYDLIYFDAFGYRVQPNYGTTNFLKNV